MSSWTTKTTSGSALFTPLKIGSNTLKHKIALAPLTRLRATKKEHVPLDFVADYYAQRGSTPGTLLITEGTVIAPQAGGLDHAPGIWSDAQIKAWRLVTEAVHAKESFIFMQLWALGRSADPETLARGGYPYVSASSVVQTAGDLFGHARTMAPRPLTIEEIKEYVDLHVRAAENAVDAGFDGVEVHAHGGYLIDQFISDITNKRTDEYGGSIANRSRFALDIVDAIAERIGDQSTAIRFSPYGRYQGVLMVDPKPTFTYLVAELVKRHPNLAYLHLVDPQIETLPPHPLTPPNTIESLQFIREIWSPRPMLVGGGFDAGMAFRHAEMYPNEVVVFGKWFISNPDLPLRIQQGLPLTVYQYQTFYAQEEAEGYIDWPFAQPVACVAC